MGHHHFNLIGWNQLSFGSFAMRDPVVPVTILSAHDATAKRSFGIWISLYSPMLCLSKGLERGRNPFPSCLHQVHHVTFSSVWVIVQHRDGEAKSMAANQGKDGNSVTWQPCILFLPIMSGRRGCSLAYSFSITSSSHLENLYFHNTILRADTAMPMLRVLCGGNHR